MEATYNNNNDICLLISSSKRVNCVYAKVCSFIYF